MYKLKKMCKKDYKSLSDKLDKLHLELSKAPTWADYIKIREDIKKIHEDIGYDFTKLKTAYSQKAIDRLHNNMFKGFSQALDEAMGKHKHEASVSELIELKKELSKEINHAFMKFKHKSDGDFKDIKLTVVKKDSPSPRASDDIVRINVDLIL